MRGKDEKRRGREKDIEEEGWNEELERDGGNKRDTKTQNLVVKGRPR